MVISFMFSAENLIVFANENYTEQENANLEDLPVQNIEDSVNNRQGEAEVTEEDNEIEEVPVPEDAEASEIQPETTYDYTEELEEITVTEKQEAESENSSYYIMGYKLQGWGWVSGKWYYFDEEGIMKTGWLLLGRTWYYFNQEGIMQTGLRVIGGRKYYLNTSGAMETGWKYIDKGWYYFTESGAAKKGWLEIGKKRYYLDSEGVMLTGEQMIDDVLYYLEKDGSLRTGWRYIAGKWYYYSENGYGQTGWQKVEGKWYYLDKNGVMQTGWKKIGAEWYYLNKSGVMQTGWQKIGGNWYYMESSGRWAPELEHKFNEIENYTYVPYVYGGNTERGWDCSGFVQWAIGRMGVFIPRTTGEQIKAGKYVDVKDLSLWRRGDLIFFTSSGYINHVALYLGNGQMMHALNERYGTYITGVYEYDKWDRYNKLAYVRRVLYQIKEV